MNVLLDNCIPRPFGRRIQGHFVRHATSLGWDKLQNGELLTTAASGSFDVLLTVDQNLPEQQNDLPLTVILLIALGNAEPKLVPFLPAIHSHLSQKLQKRLYVINRPAP